MKRMSRVISTMALLILTVCLAAPAPAAPLLAKSASVTQIGGFPNWIQDQNGLALQGCLDVAPGGRCVLPLAGEEPQWNPAAPLSFPGPPVNFPSEHFYFSADATLPQSGSLVIMAVEAAFLPTVGQGNQEMFHRFRVRVPTAPVSGTLTLDHPWGTTTFTGLDCVAGVRCDATFDVNPGTAATNFVGILGDAPEGSISRYLVHNCPGAPNPVGFIGDGISACPVVADPGLVRTNVALRIGATSLGSTDLFIVAGKKIGMEVNPSPTAQMKGEVAAAVPTATPVSLTNLSGAPIDFSAATAITIDPASPNAADFTIVAPPAGTPTCLGAAAISALAPNNVCSFNVVFNPAPSAVAARTATVNITPAAANANAPPTSLNLAGTAQFRLNFSQIGANGAVTNDDGTPALASDLVDAGANKVYRTAPANVPGTSFLPLAKVNNVRQVVASGAVTIPTVSAPQTTSVQFLRAGDVNASGGVPDLTDTLRALRIAVGIGADPTDEEFAAADVGPLANNVPAGSGRVTAADALLLLKRSLGLDPAW